MQFLNGQYDRVDEPGSLIKTAYQTKESDNMRILIADGDDELLETLQSYLRKRGHEVKIASHGLDCIATTCDFVPDVLVLDHGLLWGGCEGVLSVVQNDPVLAAVPVILIADSQSHYDGLARANVVAWLQKPFVLRDLIIQLTRISSDAQSLPLSESTFTVPAGIGPRNNHDNSLALLPPRLNPALREAVAQSIPDRTR